MRTSRARDRWRFDLAVFITVVVFAIKLMCRDAR